MGPRLAVSNLGPLPPNPQLFPSGSTQPWAQTYDTPADPAVDLFVDTNEAQTAD